MVLALVGGGEPKRVASLQARARETGVESRIRWCGEVENAAKLMAGFDTGLLISTKEGLGNTVLEYWMAGLPVVATNIPPVWEMVSTGGILVPPRSPDKIAAAVDALLSSPRLGKHLSLQGRQRVERFSTDATVKATVKLYREILDS